MHSRGKRVREGKTISVFREGQGRLLNLTFLPSFTDRASPEQLDWHIQIASEFLVQFCFALVYPLGPDHRSTHQCHSTQDSQDRAWHDPVESPAQLLAFTSHRQGCGTRLQCRPTFGS